IQWISDELRTIRTRELLADALLLCPRHPSGAQGSRGQLIRCFHKFMPHEHAATSRVGAIDCEAIVADERMIALMETATRAAACDAQVLITGEGGVGKDLIARHLHKYSARSAYPFIAVNCAGLSETLLESELFGHEKGSFTGAYRDKRGKLQMADGGSLPLDEGGEMSLRMQALLLRFLETGEIQSVGAHAAT